jgi:hypothetical protein
MSNSRKSQPTLQPMSKTKINIITLGSFAIDAMGKFEAIVTNACSVLTTIYVKVVNELDTIRSTQ